MKQALLIITMLFITTMVSAQPVAQIETGYWHFPSIDQIIRMYNVAHPWDDSEVTPITMSTGAAFGWNQKLYAPRSLHALGLAHYRYQSTSFNRSAIPLRAGFHQVSAEILIRSHPRCLVKDVQQTGPLGTRWYLQIGGGYSWNMPFAKKYAERVYIANKEKYRNISGQIHVVAGTGWHAFTIGSLAITLESTVTWFPKFKLDSFETAVLGHSEPVLKEAAPNTLLMEMHLRFTYLKKSKNWWDTPRGGDKS